MDESQSLQDQFAPTLICFGCGPANQQGLQIKSFSRGDQVIAGPFGVMGVLSIHFEPERGREAARLENELESRFRVHGRLGIGEQRFDGSARPQQMELPRGHVAEIAGRGEERRDEQQPELGADPGAGR